MRPLNITKKTTLNDVRSVLMDHSSNFQLVFDGLKKIKDPNNLIGEIIYRYLNKEIVPKNTLEGENLYCFLVALAKEYKDCVFKYISVRLKEEDEQACFDFYEQFFEQKESLSAFRDFFNVQRGVRKPAESRGVLGKMRTDYYQLEVDRWYRSDEVAKKSDLLFHLENTIDELHRGLVAIHEAYATEAYRLMSECLGVLRAASSMIRHDEDRVTVAQFKQSMQKNDWCQERKRNRKSPVPREMILLKKCVQFAENEEKLAAAMEQEKQQRQREEQQRAEQQKQQKEQQRAEQQRQQEEQQRIALFAQQQTLLLAAAARKAAIEQKKVLVQQQRDENSGFIREVIRFVEKHKGELCRADTAARSDLLGRMEKWVALWDQGQTVSPEHIARTKACFEQLQQGVVIKRPLTDLFNLPDLPRDSRSAVLAKHEQQQQQQQQQKQQQQQQQKQKQSLASGV